MNEPIVMSPWGTEPVDYDYDLRCQVGGAGRLPALLYASERGWSLSQPDGTVAEGDATGIDAARAAADAAARALGWVLMPDYGDEAEEEADDE